MHQRHFIIATAGHVDHGKSALVQALTGCAPDRLPEEKARGMTIDLGFAHLDLPAPDSNAQLSLGLIDVPGHEDFVKNMVSGVGAIDLALIVVAADDGWMPQTEEHVQILAYLGIPRAVIVLTKADLGRPEEVEASLRQQLRGTPFEDAAIVRTSTRTGLGIDELRDRLASELSSMKSPPDIGKPRLSVDRAFALHGIGTVVTGTLLGGTLKRGDQVVVQPRALPARVRMLQSHHREIEESPPGTRTALNLSDVPVAARKGDRGVQRGDVITLTGLGEANAAVDVFLTRSPRLPRNTPPIKHASTVRVHHGSGNSLGRAFFQSGRALEAGKGNFAQLRFKSPVFMFAGDRFIVRDSAGRNTLAGGVVLDPDARITQGKASLRDPFPNEPGDPIWNAGAFVLHRIRNKKAVESSSFLMKSCFGSRQISDALAQLAGAGIVVVREGFAADAGWWKGLLERASGIVSAWHKDHPDQAGLELAGLRGLLADELPQIEIFPAIVANLCELGFTRTGEIIKLSSHRPALPPGLLVAGAALRAVLAARPFDPPSRKELAPNAPAEQALRFLREIGEVVEVSADVWLPAESFEQMKSTVVKFIRENGPATVSDLRQALGSSRRIVVPFLERCDRDGTTRRTGERRILPPATLPPATRTPQS